MKAPIRLKTFLLALLLTPVLAGPSLAVDIIVDLVAEQVNVAMPDAVSVPMWKLRLATDLQGAPPPVISAVAGDSLTINLTNNLAGLTAEPVSLVINGQQATEAGAMVPVWLDGTTGARTSTAQRVRSFTHEAAANGGPATYVWGSLRAGTYLIQTGTHPSVQLPMGLYAVLKVAAAPGEAYPGIAFDGEAVLLFSEVSSAVSNAVAGGTYGTPAYPTALAVKYEPDYFLINGAPFPGSSPIAVGQAGAANPTLLRFVNAGSRERSAVIHGSYGTILALDGNPRTDLAPQYSIDLPPGGTVDVLIDAPATPGYVKISERTLGMANGGQLTYLAYSPAAPITFTLNITKSGDGFGVVAVGPPGGINCGVDCSEIYPENTALRLTAPAMAGSVFAGWTGGGCTGRAECNVTMTADTTIDARFLQALGRLAVFRNGGAAGGLWFLDRDGSGAWNATFDQGLPFGNGSDKPVAGDWNNDGLSDFGLFRNVNGQGYWYLDRNGDRAWDLTFDQVLQFGLASDTPVTGDWNNDGVTDVGVFRNVNGQGYWYLDSNGNGVWNAGVDQVVGFGLATDVPVTGDWNNDGVTDIGVFRNVDGGGRWFLDRNGNGVWNVGVDTVVRFGLPSDKPVTGDWNNDGTTDIGVFRNVGGAGNWYLDSNGNRAWDGGVDQILQFGLGSDLPVAGIW